MGAGRKTFSYTYDSVQEQKNFESRQRRLYEHDKLKGIIFGCTNETEPECLNNKLFGLPAAHWCYVQYATEWMPVFLFNYNTRTLKGIFRGASEGTWEINPAAWTNHPEGKTRYPAQLSVELQEMCPPLHEKEFKELIKANYMYPDQPQHFSHELDDTQVRALCKAFRAKNHAEAARLGVRAFAPVSPGPPAALSTTVTPRQPATQQARHAAEPNNAVQTAVRTQSQKATSNKSHTIAAQSKKVAKPAVPQKSAFKPDAVKPAAEAVTSTVPELTDDDGWEVVDKKKKVVGSKVDALTAQPTNGTVQLLSSNPPSQAPIPSSTLQTLVPSPVNASNHQQQYSATHVPTPEAYATNAYHTTYSQTTDLAQQTPMYYTGNAMAVQHYEQDACSRAHHGAADQSAHSAPGFRDALVGAASLHAISMPVPQEDGSYVNEVQLDPAALVHMLHSEGLSPSVSSEVTTSFWRLWTTMHSVLTDNNYLRSEVQQLQNTVQQMQRQLHSLATTPPGALRTVSAGGPPTYCPPKAAGPPSYTPTLPPANITPYVGGPTGLPSYMPYINGSSMSVRSISRQSTGSVGAVLLPTHHEGKTTFSNIYIFGGWDEQCDQDTSGAWKAGYSASYGSWSPLRNKWKDRGEMPVRRAYGGAVVLGRDIYLVGGGCPPDWDAEPAKYMVEKDEWAMLSSNLEFRNSPAVISMGGHIYCAGGGVLKNNNDATPFDTVESYDAVKDCWMHIKKMNRQRYGCAGCAHNNSLYVFGGYDGNTYLSDAERFDPREGKWQTLVNMSSASGTHTCVTHGDTLYVIGGYNETGPMDTVRLYDPRQSAYLPSSKMVQRRSYCTAAVAEGALYVFGGLCGVNGEMPSTVESCALPGSTWSIVEVPAQLARPRAFMNAVTMDMATT